MTNFVEGDRILVVNTLNEKAENSTNHATYTYTNGQWVVSSGELTWVRGTKNKFEAYYPAAVDFTLPTDQSSSDKLVLADRLEAYTEEDFDNQVSLHFEHISQC